MPFGAYMPGMGNANFMMGNAGSGNTSTGYTASPIQVNSQPTEGFSGGAQGLLLREREKQQEFNQNSADTAMQFASDEAQRAREYNSFMSNTAMQRRVEDLKAAGLNPMLAFSNGANGASSPQSPSPSGTSASASQAGVIDRLGQFIGAAGSLIKAIA